VVPMSVISELEAFVLDELEAGRSMEAISPREDLLARGIVDSLGITQLIAFFEDRFGVRVLDDDLVPANFRSLERMEAFLLRRQPPVRSC
jgi:acyl carrier protein